MRSRLTNSPIVFISAGAVIGACAGVPLLDDRHWFCLGFLAPVAGAVIGGTVAAKMRSTQRELGAIPDSTAGPRDDRIPSWLRLGLIALVVGPLIGAAFGTLPWGEPIEWPVFERTLTIGIVIGVFAFLCVLAAGAIAGD